MPAPCGASMHLLKSCAQSRGEIAPELTSQLPWPSNDDPQRIGPVEKRPQELLSSGQQKSLTSFRLSMSRPGWLSRTQMQLTLWLLEKTRPSASPHALDAP